MELADDATIVGMWQRWPQNGQLLFLPRPKVVYLVDDMLTDSPEGMGFFRHLVDPAERIRTLLKLEGQGYERDLRGIPIGKAPVDDINKAIKAGTMSKEDGEKLLKGLKDFVRLQAKTDQTGLVMDSTPYKGVTADGSTISATQKWGIELLTASGTGLPDIAKAIDRIAHDMAMIMGTEGLLLGGQGSSGNRALSQDKSRNFYLSVNGVAADIASGIERDIRDPVWMLNGFPDELKPKIKVEDVAFKDAAIIAKGLADMATAGAPLQPDDQAVQDMRDLFGVSRAPERTPQELADLALLMNPAAPTKPNGDGRQPPPGGGDKATGKDQQQ